MFQFSCLNWRSSRVFLVSGAGSRGFDPREGPAAPRSELAQLSWMLVPLLAFHWWHFFDQRGSAGPFCPAPAGGQRDRVGRRGTAVPFSHPIVEAVPAQPRGSSEPLPGSAPGPRDESHACGCHSWREMKHFKHLLWLGKGVVNPQFASSIEHGVKSVQCLPVRHKRMKWPQLAPSDLCKLSLNVP